MAQGSVAQVIVPLSPLSAYGFVGTVVADRSVALTGVGTTGSVGSVALGTRSKALTGNAASGAVGDVIAVYWKPIDDNQTASWQNLSNGQTPSWAGVDTNETALWEEVVT
jgi:hypothetical protein